MIVRAPAGVAARVVGPSTRTPCAAREARNSDAAYPVTSQTAMNSWSGLASAAIEPVTVIVGLPCTRSTTMLDPVPGAPVTAVLTIGTWSVGGVVVTRTGCPGAPGVTVTMIEPASKSVSGAAVSAEICAL